jgi:Flp pilus assembly protein TadG
MPMTLKTKTKRGRLSNENGQAIVEFAFIAPFLIFLLLAITQFGLAFHNYLAITDAARVGARAAAVNRASGPCAAAQTAIQRTVSAAQWSVISSRITCSPGTPGATGTPYTVSISYPFTIGLPGFFGLPALSRTGSLSTSATERLE